MILIQLCQTGTLFRRHVEICICHAQRLEDLLPVQLVQWHVCRLFQHCPQNIRRSSIRPLLSRLKQQRHFFPHTPCEFLRIHRVVSGVPAVDLAIKRSHFLLGFAPAIRIGNAGGHVQQILNADLPLRRHQFAVHIYQLLPKGRNIPRNRIAQFQLAGLPKLHGRHRRHRLGHGEDAEQGVRPHGRSLFPICQTVCLTQIFFLILVYAYAGTGDLSLLHAFLNDRIYPTSQPDLFFQFHAATPPFSPAGCPRNRLQGNTAQRLCVRCVVRFFGRLPRNSAGILPYGKGFLGNMTENLHADCVQSRQAGFVRYCLRATS